MTAAIVGIYRAENAGHVERLLAPALAAGWSTAWWALDRVAPELEAHTVGEGPGEKLPLLDEALERLGPPGGPVVLSDDDIAFERGDVVELVEVAARAGLGLAQPAHAAGSEVSHGITRAQPRSRARLTTFVESGPLRRDRPEWTDRVLPLPRERGMGWGLELDWIDLAARGLPARHRRRGPGRPPRQGRRHVRRHGDPGAHARRARGAGRRRLGAAPADARDVAPVAAPPLVGGRLMRLPWRKQTPDGATSLLVDHWYSHAVGHVIEALRRCQGYHACDPELRIALVLNGASPAELATCAPFVAEVFGVPYTSFGAPVGSPRRALQRVPRDWDYVVHHPAAFDPRSSASRVSGATTRPRGSTSAAAWRSEWPAQAPPDYAPHQQLRLELPEHEREAAPHGARRAPLDRRDAGRQRRPAPLPVDDLLAHRSSTSSGGGSPTRPSRSSGGSATAAVAPPAGSRAARSTTCSPRGPTPSTRSTGRSSSSSPWSRRRASSSRRTRDSASPRSPSGRRG